MRIQKCTTKKAFWSLLLIALWFCSFGKVSANADEENNGCAPAKPNAILNLTVQTTNTDKDGNVTISCSQGITTYDRNQSTTAPRARQNSTCELLWYARNKIFDDAGYCFASPLGKANFDNADCKSTSPKLSEDQKQILLDLRGLEKRESCSVSTASSRRINIDEFSRDHIEVVPPTLAPSHPNLSFSRSSEVGLCAVSRASANTTKFGKWKTSECKNDIFKSVPDVSNQILCRHHECEWPFENVLTLASGKHYTITPSNFYLGDWADGKLNGQVYEGHPRHNEGKRCALARVEGIFICFAKTHDDLRSLTEKAARSAMVVIASMTKEPKETSDSAEPTCSVYAPASKTKLELVERLPCARQYRKITDSYVIIDFVWPSGSKTVVESTNKSVSSAFKLNGNSAGIPNTYWAEDHTLGDCTFNYSTTKYFCHSEAPEVVKTDNGNVEITDGWCSLTEPGGPSLHLIEYGKCKQTVRCEFDQIAQIAVGCSAEVIWNSGRSIKWSGVEEWRTLDGIDATYQSGCIQTKNGTKFCFSVQEIVEAKRLKAAQKVKVADGYCSVTQVGQGNPSIGTCREIFTCAQGVCDFEYDFAHGENFNVVTAEDIVELIDGQPPQIVNGRLTGWVGIDPKCAITSFSKTKYCFSFKPIIDQRETGFNLANELEELPNLKKWMKLGERDEKEVEIFLKLLHLHRDGNLLSHILEAPRSADIDIVAAFFSTASYWPSRVVKELFEREGFRAIYTDIDFSTQDEDSMMFEYTDSNGKSYKFWTITGSESWSDWKRNLSLEMSLVAPIPTNGVEIRLKGKVLSKQFDFAKVVLDTGLVVLRTNPVFEINNSKIVVIGHSQGGMAAGVLTSMLSEYLKEKGYNSSLELVTFGNPGSGDRQFSGYYGSQFPARNFINAADVVPHLHDEKLANLFVLRDLLQENGLDIFLDTPHAWRVGETIKFSNNLNSLPSIRLLGLPVDLGDGLFADHQMAFVYLIETSRRAKLD